MASKGEKPEDIVLKPRQVEVQQRQATSYRRLIMPSPTFVLRCSVPATGGSNLW